METRMIGSSGLEVSCIGLGGMPLSISGRPEHEQGVAVVRAALDAGVTFFDTADVYCLDDADIGHNERLIAGALRELGAHDQVVVATKGGLRRPNGAWTTDGRPEHLEAACMASLKALDTDCIPLYQLHAPDDEVPFADSVGALSRLVERGAIGHVGLSNVDVAQIVEARAIIDIASVQNRCNIFDTQSFDGGVVAHCAEHNIAFLPHSPVGGHRGHARLADHQVIGDVAEAHGATAYEVVLAWLLGVSTVMIPIPGASRPASIRSSVRATELVLSDDERAALDGVAGLTT